MKIKTGKEIEFERIDKSVIKDKEGNLFQDLKVEKHYANKKYVELEDIKIFFRKYYNGSGDNLHEIWEDIEKQLNFSLE